MVQGNPMQTQIFKAWILNRRYRQFKHRVQILVDQLKSQLNKVQQRNQQIAELNAQFVELNTEKAALSKEVLENHAVLDKQITELKNQMDSQSNSQQMEMLCLQSMSNKCNEAFDTMTSFIKKMQDSRSSIINSMR